MRERPSDDERQAAREYLEHDYTRRHLTGDAAQAAHRHAEQLRSEHPRARMIALAGGHNDLGRLPRHLREHQLRERRAAGISSSRAAEIRQRGYPEDTSTRRRTRTERIEDATQSARGRAGELATTTYDAAAGTSWGGLIGQLILGGIGLSLAYLLLTGKGPVAIGKLFLGATVATRALISPSVDPLNPSGGAILPSGGAALPNISAPTLFSAPTARPSGSVTVNAPPRSSGSVASLPPLRFVDVPTPSQAAAPGDIAASNAGNSILNIFKF